MLEPEVNNDHTILDYVNDDCWFAIFQYVPARDLIRTEVTSRRWQRLVLMYLQSIHIYIVSNRKHGKHLNSCTFDTLKYKSLELWARKLGSSVVSMYCNNLNNIAIINETFPNLAAIELCQIDDSSDIELGACYLKDSLKLLKQVTFYKCCMRDHNYVIFLADRALEKLEFCHCRNFTGIEFEGINATNLKCLNIRGCNRLQFTQIVDCLGELLELKIANCHKEIGYDVQFDLEKMPKLEHLELHGGNMLFGFSDNVSKLPRLQHLSVTYELERSDLESVLRNCRELRSLQLLECQYMSGVTDVISRHGARLTALALAEHGDATDDDVVRLVRSCPALESLTVAGSSRLTWALPARAAAARGPGLRPLRLHLGATSLGVDYNKKSQTNRRTQNNEIKTIFNNLIVMFNTTLALEWGDDLESYEEYIEEYEESEEIVEELYSD